jgi:asparagine synthetase B (glutamine-hydrolysing)
VTPISGLMNQSFQPSSCGAINGTVTDIGSSDIVQDASMSSTSVEEAIHTVRSHLVTSARLRMRSDVPFAVNLSGGIDSAAIAGILAETLREEGEREGMEAKRLDVFTLAFPGR